MRPSAAAEVGRLLQQAWAADHTPEGVALAEEAVRLADAMEDAQSGFRARNQLMQIAVFSGFYEKVLVAFSWCLTKADANPENFSANALLWKYKWVLEHLFHFPRISRAQISASLDDFQARCLKSGYSERAALSLRWRGELWMGNRSGALQHYERWKLIKRDGMADCAACERNQVVELHATLGDHEKAINSARRIFEGRLRCAEIPHITHAAMLRCYWLTGQRDLADEHHTEGYRLVRSNRAFVREQSWHLAHCLRAGKLEVAASLVRKHLPWALEMKSLDNRLSFLVPARVCIERLLKSDAQSIRCRLPEGVCPVARKTVVPLGELSDWMAISIADLAAQFDARNGNKSFATDAANLTAELS